MSARDKERLLRRIEKDDAGCWNWIGGLRSPLKPYGRLMIGSRKDGTRRMIGAHQLSYTLFVGSIPAGMCVCHRCDNPRCVNPAHLFIGSKKDNALDMVQKGRSTGKLSPRIVGDIRASKLGSKTLARMYGVDDSHIRALRRGRYYETPPPSEDKGT